jgi:Spx/MgsR family transcriptional regulator
MIHLYGIPNCDTVKKARTWLGAQGHAYTFHDYKKEGADPERIAAWIAAAGLDLVVNRKGTTFRALSDADKALAADSHTAAALLVQHPSIIKRSVAEYPGGVLVGFKEEEWSAALL